MSKDALIFYLFTTQNIAPDTKFHLCITRLLSTLSNYDGMLSDIGDGSHSESDNCRIH